MSGAKRPKRIRRARPTSRVGGGTLSEAQSGSYSAYNVNDRPTSHSRGAKLGVSMEARPQHAGLTLHLIFHHGPDGPSGITIA